MYFKFIKILSLIIFLCLNLSSAYAGETPSDDCFTTYWAMAPEGETSKADAVTPARDVHAWEPTGDIPRTVIKPRVTQAKPEIPNDPSFQFRFASTDKTHDPSLTAYSEETGLFGVSINMVNSLIANAKRIFGRRNLKIFAIGSRVSGKRCVTRTAALNCPTGGIAQVSAGSSLDLVILIKKSQVPRASLTRLQHMLRRTIPFPIKIHLSTISQEPLETNPTTLTLFVEGRESSFIVLEKTASSRNSRTAIKLF